MNQPSLVQVDNLSVTYARGKESFPAVQGVSFTIEPGQTLGLVGESGSGKSTIGSVLLGLINATEGTAQFDGQPMERKTREQRAAYARRIQAVFQDPFGSMNPTRRIGWTLAEPLIKNLGLSSAEAEARIQAALAEVGMASDVVERYPGQFSGGQLQRLAIARALVMEPDLMVCDEAVSSLDLSVQAQVINLFAELAKSRGLAYLFISHDLPIVAHISDNIAVLFAGRIVEYGPAELIAEDPAHPYTQNLVLSAPVPDPVVQAERRAMRQERRQAAQSAEASAVTVADSAKPLTSGCPYARRCPFATQVCRESRPELLVRADGRSVACHRFDELTLTRRKAG